MKIAIVGTHSTGKTTLIEKLDEHLSKQGFKTAILPELSRLSPYPINERTNFEAQAWIQTGHIKYENNLYHADKILICDRSTLDNFAYFERAVTDRDIKKWEEQAANHMKTYDLIFKTHKLDIEAQKDGFRSINDEFRNDIDERIERLLKKHNINFYMLEKTIDYDAHIKIIKERIKPLMICKIGNLTYKIKTHV